jgi:hypothetical protein
VLHIVERGTIIISGRKLGKLIDIGNGGAERRESAYHAFERRAFLVQFPRAIGVLPDGAFRQFELDFLQTVRLVNVVKDTPGAFRRGFSGRGCAREWW